jgi:localization factor PodJL
MLAGGAAFLSVGAAGVVLMEGPGGKHVAPLAAGGGPAGDAPRAAVALTPGPIGAAGGGEAVELSPTAPADYAAAVKDIEAGQAGGLARLKVLAEGGYGPAEFYLAKLYETGSSGVVKNAQEARRWTERAAEAGDPAAMHNLALYYFRGEAGPQNLSIAAGWFRKAADAGVVDSQYNLGLLYQSGSGVPRDLAEAYKWFTVAAMGGDEQAHVNAQELEAKLSPTVLASANKAALDFHPTTAPAAAMASGDAVQTAQKILGRLGYYAGPVNGAASPQLKTALLSYQRDHGLPTTGVADPSTLSLLSVYAR